MTNIPEGCFTVSEIVNADTREVVETIPRQED